MVPFHLQIERGKRIYSPFSQIRTLSAGQRGVSTSSALPAGHLSWAAGDGGSPGISSSGSTFNMTLGTSGHSAPVNPYFLFSTMDGQGQARKRAQPDFVQYVPLKGHSSFLSVWCQKTRMKGTGWICQRLSRSTWHASAAVKGYYFVRAEAGI